MCLRGEASERRHVGHSWLLLISPSGKAGWIPSVASSSTSTSTFASTSTGVSTEVALAQGTPALTSDDLQLPALPPVDEEARIHFSVTKLTLLFHMVRFPRLKRRGGYSQLEPALGNILRGKEVKAAASSSPPSRKEVYPSCDFCFSTAARAQR